MKRSDFSKKRIWLLTLFLLVSLSIFCGCRDKDRNAAKVGSISDLNSAEFEIGVMTGIAAEREAKANMPNAVFKEYSMPIDAFTAICSGKIDAVVLDRPTLNYMTLAHPELTVLPEDLATGRISVAAAKKNTELMRKVNEYIREYRKFKNGEMYIRWFCTVEPEMPQIPAPEKPDGVIRIGVTANNEPLCFIKDGKLAGFDTEFSLRLAFALNKKVEFVDLPYDALVIGLESGKIDLAVAFMDAMPEREESVLFSEFYIDAPITVLVHKKLLKKTANAKISSPDDLNDPAFTIASQSGTLAEKKAKSCMPSATYMGFNGPSDCYVALSSGKINAFIYDRPALEYAALDRKDFIVLPENIGVGHIAVGGNKKQPELMQKVNEFIRRYREDGTYQQMYTRWVRTKNPVMPEIAKPQNPDGKLIIGIDTANAPMCYLADRKETGFDVEFCERLALYLNKTIEYRIIPFDGMIPALQSGKIDLSVAQMDATPEREESILFSEPYIDSYVAALIRREDYAAVPQYASFDELKGKRIGTLTGSTFDLLAKPYVPEHELFSFSQVNQMVSALESKKIDMFYMDLPISRFILQQRPKLTEMPVRIPCGDYAFVFAKDKKELCEQISAEIRKMKVSGELKKLQDKWFSSDEGGKIMPEPIQSDKELTYSAIPEMQPFAYVRNGRIVGYDIELAILIANRLGYRLNIINTDFASFVECLNSGKSDFSGDCVTITKERQESMLFSESNYDGGVSLVVRKVDDGTRHGSFLSWLRDAVVSLAESFNKTFIRESRWILILQGLLTTIVITVFSVLFGTLLAFPICMMSRSKRKISAWLADRYVSIIMGTPILVILMILYYVIFAKVDISGVIVAIIAFAMDFAAYTSVTLRSGIDGIPRGQTEAALSLGYTPSAAFFRFILPQAVRTILPVYRSEIISTLKSTSIVGYIAIMDLTKMGDIIRSRTYEAFFPLIAIAVIYFLTAKCLTSLLIFVENKLNPEYRRKCLQKRGAK